VIWFDVVARRGRAARVEGPLFNVFEVWDIIPSLEALLLFGSVVASGRDPVATQGATLVSIDASSTGQYSVSRWEQLVSNFGWILLTPFFFGEWFVANDLGNELLFRCKSHDVISVMSWINRMLRQ
jgi:hypothetical protein